MAASGSVRWIMGQRLSRPRASTAYTWTVGGLCWQYDVEANWLYLQRGNEFKRVGRLECVKVAVGFSVGVSEALALTQETQLSVAMG